MTCSDAAFADFKAYAVIPPYVVCAKDFTESK